jgi:multidrug resistance efflux pump
MTANHRPRRLFWILGVVILLATAIGAGVIMNPTHAGDTGTQDKDNSPAPFGVVCLGYVDVEAGVTPLNPPQPGKVAEVLAEEEKNYRAGEILLSMDREPAKLRLQEAEKDLALARERLRQAEKNPQRDLNEAIELQELAVKSAKEKATAASKDLEQDKILKKKSLLGNFAFEAKQAISQHTKTQVKLEEKKLEQLKNRDVKDKARLARLVVASKEAKVSQARQALKDCDVTAPVDGKVLRVQVNKGEAVSSQPKQPAILFLPAAKERIIRAEVPQEYASQVDVNNKVRIEDDTRPEHSIFWEGKVVRLSDWFTRRRSILLEPLQVNDVRTLECIVAVTSHPSKPRLRIGQRVRVKIQEKTRSK